MLLNLSYIAKAVRSADWIVRNQYDALSDWHAAKDGPFDMAEDMNHGRFVRNFSLRDRKIHHLSTNWLTGMTLYGLLALNDYLDKPEYLRSANRASYYLRALQNTMEGRPDWQGAFNERITSNRWCAPRDALSAAWGLLRLYRATREEELLMRVELFAQWHMNYAMPGGFPISYIFFSGEENHQGLLSCQSGSAAFYYDLFRLTGKPEYEVAMRRILDFFLDHFIAPDGAINIIYDPNTGRKGDSDDPTWSDMHKFNDDFGTVALLNGYFLTHRQRYLDESAKYLRWVGTRRAPDGGFGAQSLSVSSCVVALNMLNGYLATGEKEFKDLGYKALGHLETFVVNAPDDPATHGAVLGLDVCSVAGDMICLRVTQYTMYTFLLYALYENHVLNNTLDHVPAKLIDNPMFIGLKLYQDRSKG